MSARHTYIQTYIQIYIAPKIVRTNLRRWNEARWFQVQQANQRCRSGRRYSLAVDCRRQQTRSHERISWTLVAADQDQSSSASRRQPRGENDALNCSKLPAAAAAAAALSKYNCYYAARWKQVNQPDPEWVPDSSGHFNKSEAKIVHCICV